jgi:hypothetical protein
MSSIPRRLQNEVMMTDDFTCVYCGTRSPEVRVDHFVPQSLGGPDVIHNLVAACEECNSRKNDRQPHEVGLFPRYGRFAALTDLPQIPREHVARREVINPMLARQVQALAQQVLPDGSYRLSANQIVEQVRASRKVVLWLVRQARGQLEGGPVFVVAGDEDGGEL